MERRSHHAPVRAGLVVGSPPALTLMLAAGGQPVARAVAIVAFAALVVLYARLGWLIARASRSDRARSRLELERRSHMGVMVAVPLAVLALRPWGFGTIAVLVAVGLLCQAVFFQAFATVVLMRARRERVRRERQERRDQRLRGVPRTYRSV